MYARQHGGSVHKRPTMELLLWGKMGGVGGASERGGGASYTQPHRSVVTIRRVLKASEKIFPSWALPKHEAR